MAHGYRPLISKIRCINPNKAGTKKSNYNLLHYIATREGVDLTNVNTFYDSVDENVDLNEKGEDILYQNAEDETYLKYITHRPKSHGLFGNIDTENFSDVQKKLDAVSKEKRNVYRGIISLSERDAKALGYTTAAKWKIYLDAVMPDVAGALNLSPNNITWVAAFHAEDSHPHVHYMLWENEKKIRTPFIHVSQQNACREICQNAMFTEENEAIIRQITAAERKELYGIQNEARKNITDHFKTVFLHNESLGMEPVEKLPDRFSSEEHEKLNNLYASILQTLPGKGRMAYKFMPPECKAYIDQVTETFLARQDIKKEYRQYIDAVKSIHTMLGKNRKEVEQCQRDAISDLYSRTGNIILRGVDSIEKDMIFFSQEDERERNEEGDTMSLAKEAEQDDGTGDMMSLAGEIELEQGIGDTVSSGERAEMEQNTGDIMSLGEEAEWGEILGDTMSPPNKTSLNEKADNKTSVSLKELLDEKGGKYNPVLAEKTILEELEKKEDVSLRLALGRLYSNMHSPIRNQEKAIANLQKVLQEKANNFEANVLLGKLYGSKTCEDFSYEKAIHYYTAAISANPKKGSYLKLSISRIYADQKEYEQALKILEGVTDDAGSMSLQAGNIYMQQGKKEEAVKKYKESANAKIPNLYGAYQAGKYLSRDSQPEADISDTMSPHDESLKEAISYLSMAEKSVPDAAMTLAKIYLEKAEYEQAEKYFQSAFSQLDEIRNQPFQILTDWENETISKAAHNLAILHGQEDTSLYDLEKSHLYYKESRKALGKVEKDPEGRISLQKSALYRDEKSPFYDEQNAMFFLRKAANKGNEFAEYQLGKNLVDAESSYYDLPKGIEYLTKAADKGNEFAEYRLGKILVDAESPYYDLPKGIEYLTKAADKGNEFAEYQLGKIFTDEKCAYYDLRKGIEHLNKAADKNNPFALARLGMIYSNQNKNVFDADRAIKIFNNAEKAGYIDQFGTIDLCRGRMYANREWKSYDMSRAVYFFRSSANKNNTCAMIKLAKCYKYGVGVKKDVGIAKQWLRKASALGDPFAAQYLKKIDISVFRSYSYAILRQIFSDLQRVRYTAQMQQNEAEFRTMSRQAQKEAYLHRQ